VVAATELPRLLDRRDVAGLLDDAQDRGVPLGIRADIARVFLRQRVADRAAADRLPRLGNRLREALGVLPGDAQQVIRQPGRCSSATSRSKARGTPLIEKRRNP
jgi:hypothetical protein